MEDIFRAATFCIILWAGLLHSTYGVAALVPQENFLVVTSSQDSLADYHHRFGKGLISTAAFRELVIAMNPSAELGGATISEPLAAGIILTLPGRQTLEPFATLTPSADANDGSSIDASYLRTSRKTEAAIRTNADSSVGGDRNLSKVAPSQIREYQSVPSSHLYTVNYGDTLFGIALKHRMDMLVLAKLNNLQPPYHLVAGQTLLVNAEAESMMSAELGTTSTWNEAGEHGHIDKATKLNVGDYKFIAAKATGGSYTRSQPRTAVTTESVPSHADHLHELLLPSAFVLFCMSEANANNLLTDLRKNFDGMLSDDMGDQGYTPVAQYLKDQGYLRARIESDSDGRASYVSSGPRYQVGSLEIAPRQSARRAKDPKTALPVNQFYSPQVEQQLVAVAIEWLAEQGYPLADVSDMQWQFDHAQHRVNFQLWYDSSLTVHVTTVDHSGANALSQHQLNTLSPFTGSEPFSQSALEQFRSRLMATGYYENVSFELLADNTGGANGHRLEINTAPAKHNRIEAGVGYAQGRGPVVNAALTLPNITGNEDDVLLSARIDDFVQQARLAYRRRNLLWYGADVGLSARAARQDQPYFVSDLVDIHLLGAWHGRDRQDGSSWHVSLGWSSADERRLGAVDDQRFEYGRLAIGGSGRGGGVFDFAKDWSVNLAHAASLNQGSDNYWTLSATTDWVLSAPFDRHFDLRLGADIRYAENLQAIPLSAQLFHGGEASNRGYASASFSSLELDAESTAYLAFAQFEMPLGVNIRTPWLTRLIPFLDLSVMGADGDDSAKVFSSMGLGFAGEVAGYPYRADLAVPLDSQAGKGLLVNFNVGLQ